VSTIVSTYCELDESTLDRSRPGVAGAPAAPYRGRMKTTWLAALALAFAGCATLDSASQPTVPVPMSQVPPGRPGQNPGASGEVLWADLSQAQTPRRATLDDWIVDGPVVKVGRRVDGMWTGSFLGRPVTLATAMGTISGSGVDLVVERHGAGTRITGSVFDAPVNFELTVNRVKGFAGANVFDLSRQGPGQYDSPAGMLTLRGAAGTNAAPMPQVALALVAVLLR
jgi:hypothetical protein